MKTVTLFALLACFTFSTKACAQNNETLQVPSTYDQGLKFCEGTVKYKNALLVSNFGTEKLDPLNTMGKG